MKATASLGTLREYPIKDIKIGKRFRKDLGDIDTLAASIKEHGLLHPIIVLEDHEFHLQAGRRRLEACKLLGHKTITGRPWVFDDSVELIENLARQDFAASEIADIADSLFGKPGRPKTGSRAPIFKGRTREIISKLIGISDRKARKLQHIVEESKKHPKEVIPMLKKIDQQGTGYSIDKAYNDVKRLVRRKDILKSTPKKLPKSIRLVHGDFRFSDIQPNSVDLIVTDPPYKEKDLPIYADLFKFAARVLKDGGSLITFAGQYALDIILMSNATEMKYWWILAVQHAGFGTHAVHKYKVIPKWKPMLWFVKGKKPGKQTEYVLDMIESKMPDKSTHEWAQGSEEMEYYMKYLTRPGDVVLDPMMGAGTFGIAAINQKCKFIGIDINAENVKIAKRVLAKLDSSNLPER